MSKEKRRLASDGSVGEAEIQIGIDSLADLVRDSAVKIAGADIDTTLELAALICGGQAEIMETEGQAGYQEWHAAAEKLENRKLLKKHRKTLRRIIGLSDCTGGFLFFVCLPRQTYADLSAEDQSMFQAVLFTMLFGTPANAISGLFGTENEDSSPEDLFEVWTQQERNGSGG